MNGFLLMFCILYVLKKKNVMNEQIEPMPILFADVIEK